MLFPTVRHGDGSKVTFETPAATLRTVYVGGVLTVPASQDTNSITLASAPGRGVAVQIYNDNSLPLSSKSPVVLFQQNTTGGSVTGTLTATVLFAMLIPGKAIGPNGRLRITAVCSVTSNANAKQIGISFGGTALVSNSSASNATAGLVAVLANRGSEASQLTVDVTSKVGNSGLSTVDTTKDQILQITGTLANVGDSMAIELLTVELLP